MIKTSKADIYISDREGDDVELIEQLPFEQLVVSVAYLELWDNPQAPEATENALAGVSTGLGRHGFNRIVWGEQDYLSWKSPRFRSSRYPEVRTSG